MIIRRITAEDLPTRVKWMNSPKVYQSMHFDVPVHLDKTIAWFDKNLLRDDRVDVTFCDEMGGGILAFGGLTNIVAGSQKGELYIFVDPEAQHSGIGTTATMLLCDFGFRELRLNKICLETNEDNFAAQRVYEKCGFVLEGRLRQEYLAVDGIVRDRLYYGLLRKDYVKRE